MHRTGTVTGVSGHVPAAVIPFFRSALQNMRLLLLLVFLVFLVFLWSSDSQANLLGLDQIMTGTGTTRAEFSLVHAHSQQQQWRSGGWQEIQTGHTAFVLVPTRIGATQVAADHLIFTAGLRHGLSARLEGYGRVHGLLSHTRQQGSEGDFHSHTDQQLQDVWVGMQYQFAEDGDQPALLGFLETALRERQMGATTHARSWMIGGTTYRAVDPIVLLLTAAYRHHWERQVGDHTHRPGNLIFLNPSLAFAVNDRITLQGGWQWERRAAPRVDGLPGGFWHSTSHLSLGMGYGFAKGNSLSVQVKFPSTGEGNSEIRLNWVQRLGRRSPQNSLPAP